MEDSDDLSLAEQLAGLDPELRERILAGYDAREREALAYGWPLFERPGQSEPELPWRTWLVMSGRGYGKTRMGAEWVRRMAADPRASIALVGATKEQARAWMIENDNGVLGVCPPDERPEWEPSLWRLKWPSGATGFVYSAAEPESLRGPQHHYAWCDEIAKWPFGMETWSNLMLGLRRGSLPRVVATTTPRPVPLVRKLIVQQSVALTRGRTIDNATNLSGFYISEVIRDYGSGRLARQELLGELIEDNKGSLWPRDLIEKCRAEGALPEWRRVVVGIDPPVSAEGTCGIVVCALGSDGNGYVVADASVAGLGPEGWARGAAAAAEAWGADRLVAEGNQGGAMVETVLRGADVALPVRIVHARQGKSARAEPVAALFVGGRARFAGGFPELEDQLAGMIEGGGYEGPGRSPDRADAMVWAMTELMLGKKRAEPRIRLL